MKKEKEIATLLSPPADAAIKFQMDPFLTKGLMGSKLDQLKLIKNCVKAREAAYDGDPSLLLKEDLETFVEDFANFEEYLGKCPELTSKTKGRLRTKYYYYIWKSKKIPSHAKDICVLGCGPGYELFFIRYLHPECNLTAIDYRNSILPDILKSTGVEFFEGVVPDCLADYSKTFDVVFSNHVIEHMIDPDAAFVECFRILKPGGAVVAALPLEGSKETAFSDLVQKELLGPKGPSLLNMSIVDLGHPWKTNASDLHSTVAAAGFEEVTVTQRACAYDWSKEMVVRLDDSRRRKGEFLYHLVISPVKVVLNTLFGRDKVPTLIQRIVVRLESKVWFGGNTLKSATSPEALVVGKKNAI